MYETVAGGGVGCRRGMCPLPCEAYRTVILGIILDVDKIFELHGYFWGGGGGLGGREVVPPISMLHVKTVGVAWDKDYDVIPRA